MRADDRMLGAVLEALPDPAVVTDSRRRIVLVNQEALATFGYGPAELLRRPSRFSCPWWSMEARCSAGGETAPSSWSRRGRPARTRSGPLEIVCVHGIGETRVDQAARHAERLVTFGLLAAEVAHESKTSTKARGHGHGLASIGRIVRAHGAAIEVQSEPGRGTAFIVTFPARAAGDERGDNQRSVAGPSHRQAGDPQQHEQDQESAADTEKSREHTHAPSGSENSG